MADNPFGVLVFLQWNHPWNNYHYSPEKVEKAVRMLKELGVGWVRMDFLWSDIEPKENEFDFEKYDRIVNLLCAQKINILGVLQYNANWTSPAEWNSPPDDTSLFTRYVKEVIKRYKDKIKHWELWNEPDSPVYWAKQDGLKSYVALLKEVYRAAKETDPECKILNGGLANGLASINLLYDNGAKDYFDILNLHFFTNPYYQNAIRQVEVFPKLAYKIMLRNGDGNKKIWITEIGCPGVKIGLNVPNWWLGKNPSEEMQADWLKKVFRVLLEDENVEKVFWAFFRDTDKHWGNGIDYFGLVRFNFTKKPGFKAYQEAIKEFRRKKK